METTEQAVQVTTPRQRRVGTFTLGIVLVTAGAGMLAAMFWPRFHPEWLLKASPCILILLGIEGRRTGEIRLAGDVSLLHPHRGSALYVLRGLVGRQREFARQRLPLGQRVPL